MKRFFALIMVFVFSVCTFCAECYASYNPNEETICISNLPKAKTFLDNNSYDDVNGIDLIHINSDELIEEESIVKELLDNGTDFFC